jgi:hypothetical protein
MPAELPVALPARCEFVINRATASALRFNLPSRLLIRADATIG